MNYHLSIAFKRFFPLLPLFLFFSFVPLNAHRCCINNEYLSGLIWFVRGYYEQLTKQCTTHNNIYHRKRNNKFAVFEAFYSIKVLLYIYFTISQL